MKLGLTGRVALVVGGTGTVGSAVARALLDEGAIVVIAARTRSRLDELALDLGSPAELVEIDTLDQDSVDRAVADVLRRFGRIDVLVATAAPSARTLDRSRDRDPAHIIGALDGKAMSYLRCINAVLPHMLAAGFGRIVSVSGQNARLSASVTGVVRNTAVIATSKTIADSVAGTGVTLNVVNPGLVTETPAASVEFGGAGDSTPAQVAALTVFLASDQAAAISGESIAVGHRLRGVQ